MTLVIAADEARTTVGDLRAFRLAGPDDAFAADLARRAVTGFADPAFVAALIETIGATAGAEAVLIGVADAAGRPLALFPFTLRRQGGLRLIEGLGFGVTDYYAPLLAAGVELDAAATTALWRAVRAALPPADLVRLINVPRSLYGARHALSAAAFLGPMGHGASVLSYRDAAGQQFDPATLGVARDVRRKLKKLAALGETRFYVATTPEEVAALMDALVAMRQARFAQLGRRDKLDEPGVEAFYRRLAADGLARVYGLAVGGEIVAVVYGLAHDGVFTLLIPTMSAEERYQAGSPGLVSLLLAIEASLAAGDRVFDFSVGELFYKTRFPTEKVELLEHVEALSALGLAPALAQRARTAARLGRQQLRGRLGRLRARLRPVAAR